MEIWLIFTWAMDSGGVLENEEDEPLLSGALRNLEGEGKTCRHEGQEWLLKGEFCKVTRTSRVVRSRLHNIGVRSVPSDGRKKI